MTSHLNSHRTTDIKPEMLSVVQTGIGTPHDKYNIHGIAHARTNRKDDIFMQRRLVQNFTFILEWCQETFPACCLVHFAAFLYSNPLFFKISPAPPFNHLMELKVGSHILYGVKLGGGWWIQYGYNKDE